MSELELAYAECLDLLATDTVGRVAFTTPEGPRIVPVNYALEGDGAGVPDHGEQRARRLRARPPIAFEVDHLDGERRRGWSVVAHGPCARMDEPPSAQSEGESWAGGRRPLRLRLEWTELTGRRVGGGHWPHPVVSGRGRSY